MILTENSFKILESPHVSEKSSLAIEKRNTFTIKVLKKATKKDIKTAIQKIFNIKVKNINTLIVKGKTKKNKNYKYHRNNWKKAYISLQKGQNIDFNINKN
ncbi:50S ribosomal protein L23 [Enterobacteriaceae endosymbiont of Plateumaris braccata]|uniref:50S ribosomal protein L23 n=1 Tax=Enterobacteriaceae endosymbiont of Plateumaris braccata TaxID=2675793 RepID=UPI001449D245|nr:50S ribosomal protein L23 [Enterobacteriaceae endosymbiont of Plateumaris braccata]QJC28237.1 50S ribosomal protein L23 [Enterobacteriaceae endosymbiont of Plateumaris braccata]